MSYKTSDFLKDRHPYRDKSFAAKQEDARFDVHYGFGKASLQRNIAALLDPHFPLQSKQNALKIILDHLCSVEIKIQALNFGIVNSINEMLKSVSLNEPMKPTVDEYCGRIVEKLCTIAQGREAIFNGRTIPLLLDVTCRVEESGSQQQSDRIAAAKALRMIARSFEGCHFLLKVQPPSNEPALPTMKSKEKEVHNTITSLISVLRFRDSMAVEELLQEVLTTLALLCGTPDGRYAAAKQGIATVLHAILCRKWMFDPSTIETTARTVDLCTKLFLDGVGQQLGFELLQTLGCVLFDSLLTVQDMSIIKNCLAALRSVCVNESAKTSALNPLPLSQQPTPPLTAADDEICDDPLNVTEVLCLLLYLFNRQSNSSTAQPLAPKSRVLRYTGLFSLDNSAVPEQLHAVIEDTAVCALRLLAENPKARETIATELCYISEALFQKVFKGTTLFRSYTSSKSDLVPEALRGVIQIND